MTEKLLHLHLFDNTNVTTDGGLTAEMKTFYDKTLIRYAGPELVHDQFGQKKPIPKNGGKTIEFRAYKPLPKATKALTEGVTPQGQKLSVSKITAEVKQYGGYVELSDVLILTAIDNNLAEATRILGQQAGQTLDTITREVLSAGTNVQYAGAKSQRSAITKDDVLKVDEIKKAVRTLKGKNAKKIDGYYVAIIHPDTEYDLMKDPEWVDASKYAGSTQIFNGEIGKLYGVRFVESTEAKIWNTGEGEAAVPIYSTLVLGADAYGVTEITGGGLETIVKPLGSGGTADPLNQRATVGWKGMKTAEILVEEYMVRIEHASSAVGKAN